MFTATPAAPTTTTATPLTTPTTTTTTTTKPSSTVPPTSPPCSSCGSILEGEAYNDGMTKGIATITENSGSPCTQTISCSRLDASPDGFVQLSVEMQGSGAPQGVAYETTTAMMILQCTASGYVLPEYPQFPLTNTINCECEF